MKSEVYDMHADSGQKVVLSRFSTKTTFFVAEMYLMRNLNSALFFFYSKNNPKRMKSNKTCPKFKVSFCFGFVPFYFCPFFFAFSDPWTFRLHRRLPFCYFVWWIFRCRNLNVFLFAFQRFFFLRWNYFLIVKLESWMNRKCRLSSVVIK